MGYTCSPVYAGSIWTFVAFAIKCLVSLIDVILPAEGNQFKLNRKGRKNEMLRYYDTKMCAHLDPGIKQSNISRSACTPSSVNALYRVTCVI